MIQIKKLISPFFYVTFAFTVSNCVPVQSTTSSSTSNKVSPLEMVDKNYDPNIKTVQLYPSGNTIADQMLPPIINKSSTRKLVLEFDELTENASGNYKVKIYNCTADWKISSISSLQYLFEYNEHIISDYDYSLATDFPYVHYKFEVPPVKLSGNYLLTVYRNDNDRDLLLSKRFMVFEDQVETLLTQPMNNMVNITRENQQIEFVVKYKNYRIENPRTSIKVQLRQNGRWDNIITNIQPAFVREDVYELEYRFFDNDNLFKGGNEFRVLDLRSMRNPGYRVKNIVRDNGWYKVNVAMDKSRKGLAYTHRADKNGRYYISNQDFDNASYSSNYAFVKFNLKGKSIPDNTPIYLFGSLTNYELNSKTQLKYNANTKSYEVEVLLKQGHYDYQYYVQHPGFSPNFIEGDHFETENEYEILIYHRPFGARTDLLIGYKLIDQFSAVSN